MTTEEQDQEPTEPTEDISIRERESAQEKLIYHDPLHHPMLQR